MERLHGELWRLRLRASGAALENQREMERWASLGGDAVRTRQRDQLARVVRHAHDHVPYYRECLQRCGLASAAGLDMDRFADLPVLDKATIREQGTRLRADDLDGRRLRINRSGGSTGEPIQLVQDAAYKDWNTATKLFFEARTGHRLGARTLHLWGSERDVQGVRRSWRSRLGQRLRNEEMLDTFRMSLPTMRSYVARINTFRPSLIVAYAESIYRLARLMDEEGLEVHAPRAIFTSASTLDDTMRAVIRRVFRAPVFDRYGSREVGVVACEQPGVEGLAVSAPTHFVEILAADGRPAAPGETGEVVVTSLRNYAMPLLRYRIGDLAAWPATDDGAAGSLAWPRLARISGRVSDTFFTPEGTQVFGEYFTHLFYERPWVDMFQVVQEELDLVRIRIVPGRDAPRAERAAEEERALAGEVRGVMGPSCRVEVAWVEAIEPSASGKHRFTISKVRGEDVMRH